MPNSLLILHVQIKVKSESIEAFREATFANANASIKEPGVLRFDVMEDSEDPSRFVLSEVYRNADAHAAHRETSHYQTWRDTVGPWMAEPRVGRRFVNVFPDDSDFLRDFA